MTFRYWWLSTRFWIYLTKQMFWIWGENIWQSSVKSQHDNFIFYIYHPCEKNLTKWHKVFFKLRLEKECKHWLWSSLALNDSMILVITYSYFKWSLQSQKRVNLFGPSYNHATGSQEFFRTFDYDNGSFSTELTMTHYLAHAA